MSKVNLSFLQLLCACPPAVSITDVPTDDCIERLGQILKVVIQRTKENATTENMITIATNNPEILATWNALKTAADSTKVQASPIFVSATTEPGEAIESGGGNDSVGGIATIVGRNPTAFSAMFEDVKQKIITALKSYECEKELSVYFVNASGQIIGQVDDPDNPTTFKGFPIRSFFVSDKVLGGYDSTDKNNLRFSMLPNWSDDLYVITPTDFNPLTQL